ncbi:winged helix-turn-helix domain-containing protein, partial [Phaeovibrio sulfidiphilus]
TLTKEQFLNHLYGGMDEPDLKIIDVFVCKLRKKLAAFLDGETCIETVWGRGYMIRDPEQTPSASPEAPVAPVAGTAKAGAAKAASAGSDAQLAATP